MEVMGRPNSALLTDALTSPLRARAARQTANVRVAHAPRNAECRGD